MRFRVVVVFNEIEGGGGYGIRQKRKKSWHRRKGQINVNEFFDIAAGFLSRYIFPHSYPVVLLVFSPLF